MIHITFYEPDTGRVRGFTTVPSEDVARRASEVEGCPYILGLPPANAYVQAGEFVSIPEAPDPGYTFDYAEKAWVDLRTLDDLKTAKQAEADTAYTQSVAGLHAGATEAERQTWATQRAEAATGEPGPFITALAEARGVDPVAALEAVRVAVSRYDAQAAALLGQWQALRDAIRLAKSPADLSAITIP